MKLFQQMLVAPAALGLLASGANAAGRLIGTLLSGAIFLLGGMQACLWTSCLLVGLAWLTSLRLPPTLRSSSLLPIN
jgi:hypothetical protein